MFTNIDSVGSYKKEGNTIKVLVVKVNENTIDIVTPENYDSILSKFIIETTETFTPDIIEIVSDIENISNIDTLKELETNGHIVMKEITNSKTLEYITKSISKGTKIDMDLI